MVRHHIYIQRSIASKGKAVESWSVQLFTLLGVAIGALSSFVSTRVLDRSRWRREESLRWDSKRLECYSEFAGAMMRYINIGHRITAGLGLTGAVQGIDTASGLPALGDAEADLSVKWENVLMLGSPEVIAAAQEWREEAWSLDRFARGIRKDLAEYRRDRDNRREAQRRFYIAVRADLGVTSGEVPRWYLISDASPS